MNVFKRLVRELAARLIALTGGVEEPRGYAVRVRGGEAPATGDPDLAAPVEPGPAALRRPAGPVRTAPWRARLRAPASVREAFVLKTILDRPVGLRGGRRHTRG